MPTWQEPCGYVSTRRHGLLCTLLFLLAFTRGLASAAPPKADSLFPGGGQRGTTVEVTVGGGFDNWPPQFACDRSDVRIVLAEEKGKFNVTLPAEAPPGLMRLRFYDKEGTAPVKAFFIGGLPEILETEPNDTPGKPEAIATLPVVVNGRLMGGSDADLFAVQLTAGQTLVAAVEAHRLLGSPVDCVLQVLTADGFVLEQNDDECEIDPLIAFTAPSDGRYLVRVFGFPSVTDSSIALSNSPNHVYRLTLTTGGYADHAWPLALAANAPNEVSLIGWNLPPEGLKLPAILPTALPPAGAEPLVAFDAALGIGADVSVEPHPVTLEAEPNSADVPRPITLPTTVTGRIDSPGDVDAYLIEPQAGQTFLFRLDGPSLGAAGDPVLKLLDAEGKVVTFNDDLGAFRDCQFFHTFAAAGQFRLAVSDLHQQGGLRHVYRLRATLHPAQPLLTVTADNFTLPPGKPLEIPVAIERRMGFAEEIEFSVEGLPANVTLAPVKSVAPGETAAAVKLVLTATAGPFSGTIKIIGRSLGDSKLTALATPTAAPYPAPRPISQEIWLTVP
ncbi:MAG: PPC domain-containing protein [Pirellulales bacterium]